MRTILPCITFVSEDYIRYIRWLSKRARLWVHIGKSLFGWVGANTLLLSPHVYKYCLSFHHLSLLPTSHISNDYSALILLPNPKSHPPSTLITSALTICLYPLLLPLPPTISPALSLEHLKDKPILQLLSHVNSSLYHFSPVYRDTDFDLIFN